MIESVLPFLSFVPPILLVVDLAELLIRRRPAKPSADAPSLQIWLQDLLILPLMFVGAMAYGFDRTNWLTASFPVLAVVLGFAASVDVASSFKKLSSMRRLAIFIGTIAAFAVCSWLCVMLWFFWKRLSARRAGRFCVDRLTRNCAAFAMLFYGVAFFLSMPIRLNAGSPGDVSGWRAYYLCFALTFRGRSPDLLELPLLVWMANPCLWISVAFLLEGRRLMAAACAIFAMLLGLTLNGPTQYTIFNSLAYFVWSFSMMLSAILALFLALQRFRVKQTRAIV